jgi:putative transposase
LGSPAISLEAEKHTPATPEAINKDKKNETIRTTLQATRMKRQRQLCKQYEFKLDKSHLGEKTEEALRRLFIEAKWYYNSIVECKNIFDIPQCYDKTVQLRVKVKDNFETRELTSLTSQMKQELLDRARDSIRGLSRLKASGRNVGMLKFKSSLSSIPLKQYRNTWWIVDRSHVHIQGIKQKLRVRGMVQVPKDAEMTSALLVRKHGDYYLHISTYQERIEKEQSLLKCKSSTKSSIGLDLGIKNQLTLSNGIQLKYRVPASARIKKLQRELGRRKHRGRNWFKTKTKLGKEYDRSVNRKRDIRNKLLHKLTRTFPVICYQNDPIKAWQKTYGERILSTALGGITSALKQKAHTPILVPRFFPSTRKCSRCHAIGNVKRNERVCHCASCGLVIDRDLNAAINIEMEGLINLRNGIPAEDIMRREFTPADTNASALTDLVKYLNNIPRVSASIVEETGSPAMIVVQRKPTIFSRG